MATTTLTFGDFIIECQLFPYSRENFEFMKDCREIELSEKFISDQVFLAEAREVLADSTINLEENFFQESVDNSSLEVMTEKVNTKVKGLVGKMINRILKVFRVFSKFFGKIGNKFDPITVKGQEVLKMLANVTFDDEKLEGVKKIVNNAKGTEASAFPIRANQPFKKRVKLKYGGHDKDVDTLRNDLAVALSNDKVVAEALLGNDGDLDKQRIGIMDPDDLYTAGMTLCVGKEAAVMNVGKTLLNSWMHVKKAGLVIDVNTKSINNTAERLNELCDKISEAGGTISNNVSQTYAAAKTTVNAASTVAAKAAEKAGDNKDAKDTGEDENNTKVTNVANGVAGALANLDANMPKASEITKVINDSVVMLTSAIGLTTKVYTQLNAYRQSVINGLYDYLKNLK